MSNVDPVADNPNFIGGRQFPAEVASPPQVVTVSTGIDGNPGMSALRSALMFAGTLMVAYGKTDQTHWTAFTDATFQVIGGIGIVSSFVWSQLKHAGFIK
jgi:hypothetical protein